jgi:DNA-binding PadR family transcriptional regulator
MTSPAAYRSPWALTILSLLFERDMHPYELRRLVRHRGTGDLVDLRPGSLYRTIERLERAGLVEPVETTREGRFPERTVYRLTERGRDELEEWLRELLSTPMKDFPQFLHAVSALSILEHHDARIQLEGRLVRLEAEIAQMETAMRRLETVLPRLFQLETEYAIALRRADLAWVSGVVEDLRTGRLTWTYEELKALYGHFGEGLPLDLKVVEDDPAGREDSTMA